MTFAKALVLAWTRLYTAGLPEEMRLRRRAEIQSDLWEFEHDPTRPRFASAHLLLRLLGGIWHDVSWRFEQRTPYVAAQRLMLSGTPRHPVVVTSAFTCSLTVHLVVGAAATWLLAFPFHQRPVIADLGGESAPVPAPEFSGSGHDETASTGSGPAQTNSFLAKLLQNRYPLSVRDGQLSGEGAQVLNAAIAQSRFVLLGENHGNPQTPEFFGAVCNTAAPMGFRTLAVEGGPLTAAKLAAWAKQSDGLAELRAFETRSPDWIHLYSRREEFEMLQQCARAGRDDFHFWGLIEEGIFRTPPAGNAEARRREDVMKSVFAANYEKAASTAASPPKVLLKFGAFHVYRGVNPLGGTGIGNYVAEFARKHGAESLHIRLMPVNQATQYLQPMVDHLLPSSWTMFDVRPLRQDLNTPGSTIDPDLATLVFGYDILVIVP